MRTWRTASTSGLNYPPISYCWRLATPLGCWESCGHCEAVARAPLERSIYPQMAPVGYCIRAAKAAPSLLQFRRSRRRSKLRDSPRRAEAGRSLHTLVPTKRVITVVQMDTYHNFASFLGKLNCTVRSAVHQR